jgi:hypothetical protein
MTLERKIARTFALDDAPWLRNCEPVERDPAYDGCTHPDTRILCRLRPGRGVYSPDRHRFGGHPAPIHILKNLSCLIGSS